MSDSTNVNAVYAAERRLERARAELRDATERLGALRRAALAGEHNADALDDAVFDCRDAEAAVAEARAELARLQERAAAEPVPAGSPALSAGDAASVASEAPSAAGDTSEEPVAPLEITPRLRFARWLVETGRLSEQRSA